LWQFDKVGLTRWENHRSGHFTDKRDTSKKQLHSFGGNIPTKMEACTDDHSAKTEHAALEERTAAVDK
jgi:hypothetical protein